MSISSILNKKDEEENNFKIGDNVKVKITKVDNTGATFVDPKTNLPTVLGKDALQGLAQRQQALQTVAQMSKPATPSAGTATQAPKVQ